MEKTLAQRLAELLLDVAVYLEAQGNGALPPADPEPAGEKARKGRVAKQKLEHVRWYYRSNVGEWAVCMSTGLHENAGVDGRPATLPEDHQITQVETLAEAQEAGRVFNEALIKVLAMARYEWENHRMDTHRTVFARAIALDHDAVREYVTGSKWGKIVKWAITANVRQWERENRNAR